MFHVIAMQRFDFQISIISIHSTISCYDFTSVFNFIMILKYKSDFEVAVLQRGHRMPVLLV